MDENVEDGGEINVVAESGQGLKGGRSANGLEVDLWDDLGQMGGNVRWPVLFTRMKVRQRSVFEDKVREGTVAFDGDSADDDQSGKGDQEREEGGNHSSLSRARTKGRSAF